MIEKTSQELICKVQGRANLGRARQLRQAEAIHFEANPSKALFGRAHLQVLIDNGWGFIRQ